MNKRYIDFVPARSATAKKPKEPVVFVQKREVDEIEIDRIFEAKDEKKPAGVTIRKDDKRLDIPKAHFVNTEKISKRPLSKNVTPRKIVVAEEEKPSKPVTIIEKPEKDSKMSMVVAIIITIILGAAAGTVAFLLLPN